MSAARARALAPAELREAVPLFAALGDKRRLRLLERLAEGPASITELSAEDDVSRQAVTKHLRVLRGAHLVRDTWRGRERLFELEPERLELAQAYLERIGKQWDDALQRLKAHVERTV